MGIVCGIPEPGIQLGCFFGRHGMFPPIRGGVNRFQRHVQFVGEKALEEAMCSDDPHGDLLAGGR